MRTAIALLLATACRTAIAGDAPAPAPAILTAEPTHVSRGSNLWFDGGKLQGGQESLHIGLAAPLSERVRIIEVLSVELVEAVGDDGRPLRLHEDGGSGGGGGDPGRIDVQLAIVPPAPTVRALRSLTATVRCRVAAEALRRTQIRPLKDWIAKRLRVEGVAGGEIELENLGAESLTLGMTPALEQAIENIRFTTADGDDVEHEGWNDGQEPGWLARVVQIAMPPDGAIVLDLRQGLGERTFTIRASDVPIALPDRAKEPVGVLRPEPLPEDPAPEAAPVQMPAARPGF